MKRALRKAYIITVAAARDARSITPAADWLVDNFHVVQEQVRAIRVDLPPGFHKQLPRLINGPFQGSAGLRPVLGLRRPHRQPLRPADAVPLPARLPDRAATDDRRALGGRDHAARRAGRESTAPGRGNGERPGRAPGGECTGRPAPRRRDRTDRKPCSPALRRRCRRLSRSNWSAGCAKRTREPRRRCAGSTQRLAAQGTTADKVVEAQQQRQGAANVTIRNVITSMRLMSSIDWRDVFESVSLVRRDFAGGQQFCQPRFPDAGSVPARDRGTCAGSLQSESEIASRIIQAASRAGQDARNGDAAAVRRADPGYYLVAKGRRAFEKSINCRVVGPQPSGQAPTRPSACPAISGLSPSSPRSSWDWRWPGTTNGP